MSEPLGIATLILFLASAIYFLVLMFDWHPRIASVQSGMMLIASAGLYFHDKRQDEFLTLIFLTMSWILIRRAWLSACPLPRIRFTTKRNCAPSRGLEK